MSLPLPTGSAAAPSALTFSRQWFLVFIDKMCNHSHNAPSEDMSTYTQSKSLPHCIVWTPELSILGCHIFGLARAWLFYELALYIQVPKFWSNSKGLFLPQWRQVSDPSNESNNFLHDINFLFWWERRPQIQLSLCETAATNRCWGPWGCCGMRLKL